MKTGIRSAFVCVTVSVFSSTAFEPAIAHELSVASVDLKFASSTEAVISFTRNVNSAGAQQIFVPVPEACRPINASKRSRNIQNATRTDTLKLTCEDLGSQARLLTIEPHPSRPENILVRVEQVDGSIKRGLISKDHPSFLIPEVESPWSVAGLYFDLGWKHLLAGYDHLAFLLGLVFLVGWSRKLVALITAFTVGHSVSLIGIGLFGWSVSSFWAECGIAASIIYLGLEIMKPREHRKSFVYWALAFGLVHGMGFAGSLLELGWSKGDLWLSLLAFNLGIEFGQLLIIALSGALIRFTPAVRILDIATPSRVSYVLGGTGSYALIRHVFGNIGLFS